MTLYEIWCRPHGRPDMPASMAFVLDAVDHRAAWQQAMTDCFRGCQAQTPQGDRIRLEPRRWTVHKVKLHAGAPELAAAAAADDGWPRPAAELLSPELREAELHRLYAGQLYDSYRIRPGRTLMSFGGRGRPVMVPTT